ncbi:DUF1592 domain-containing protein [Bryobacter aggregatus]|uniref:DUF1592 domain-containing protein n=1 Tax=Bryobacter aggregatus TaxID=360054 RepID=UPI0004E28A3B|nr:DUF1592 domain-containing protein [Bryobacter aggregatus]
MKSLALALFATSSLLAAQSSPEADAAAKTVNRYCFSCHNQTVKSGGISLQGIKTTDVPGHAETWEKVLRKVRGVEMPPPGAPKPTPEAAKALVTFLDTELDRNSKANPSPGSPSIHRLNRAEYSNAIRDLLALDLDHSASLPADDSGYGFDNIGEVLTTSPLLMEKYMSTGRRVARLAVGTVKASAALERYTAGKGREALSSDALPISVRNGMALHRYFPLDADYSITVRVRGTPDPDRPPAKLDIRVDGARVELLDATVDPSEQNQATRLFEIRLPLKAGMHDIGAAFLEESSKAENGIVRRAFNGANAPAFSVGVEYIAIGGPFNAKGAGDTASRQRIFSCRPTTVQQEAPCARKILTPLARRAYRRPVQPGEIEPLMKLFAAGRKDGGSFDAGIETALRAILVSPSFLFRIEQSPKPGTIQPITELELASRLSFFLWSSIPDDELLTLASQNKLRPVLNQQVKRMIADPKANALVDNFAGQWLHMRNIPSWRPDPDKYPQFDENLRAAFQKETELFFRYIIREDRSVLDFISADYTFLNERLARHYGVKGVNGNYFRKVAIDPNERGGILSQGGVLMVTSYPTRTSPVLRGKWILDNILGSPPPPPPPDVPDLEDKAATSPSNLRAALEKHRSKAACASCHSRLDPLGFSLENYDAVGRYRKVEGGSPIDASGAMPNGTTVDGPGSLKQILMGRQDEFVDCLAEKLLTYALGRGLDHNDLPVVRQIRREAAVGESRFSALALAVVNSVPFQKRKSAGQ